MKGILLMEKNKRKRLTKEERLAVLAKTNSHCAYCGCKLEYKDLQVDHIFPVYLGGKNEMSNYLPACRSCNKYKDTCTVEVFRKALEHMPAALERDCTTYKIAHRFGIVQVVKPNVEFYFEKIGLEVSCNEK